ncbi:MAG: trans-sulfuration enzyme family protein [Cytophagales bacterium]
MSTPNFETQAIRTQTEKTIYKEHSTPLFLTSSFVFDDAEHARALFADEISGNIYTRFSNPNNSEFIEKLCLLEGTDDGIAVASGMSAMFTSMAALLKSGDNIISCRSVFGSTHQILTQILPNWGITATFVDIDKPDTWESYIQPNTKMFFVETPSNPSLQLIDLEFLANLCEKHQIISNVDNCFATPYLQNPAKWGIDLVTHSATKFIDGQGRVIAGAILGKAELIKEIRFFARHTGPALSPFNSWILSKSLETLAVRMDRHCENAIKTANFLEKHPEVEKVIYPFLDSHPQKKMAQKQMMQGGGLVTFIVKGGVERGRRLLNSLQLFSHSANLGDTRTIVTHPASTTHSKLTEEDRNAVGILPGMIRISVGLEHIDDIFNELNRVLSLSKI